MANIGKVLQVIGPAIDVEFEEGEADDLVAFLKSLTDDAARNLSNLAPASVPSGLSIDK